eukprot:119270-Prorocentrum_minimum.AAC.3
MRSPRSIGIVIVNWNWLGVDRRDERSPLYWSQLLCFPCRMYGLPSAVSWKSKSLDTSLGRGKGGRDKRSPGYQAL